MPYPYNMLSQYNSQGVNDVIYQNNVRHFVKLATSVGSIRMNDMGGEECLVEAEPGNEAFRRLSPCLQFVCREVPIGITDSDADYHLIGLGYFGKLPQYIGKVRDLVLDAGAKSIV